MQSQLNPPSEFLQRVREEKLFKSYEILEQEYNEIQTHTIDYDAEVEREPIFSNPWGSLSIDEQCEEIQRQRMASQPGEQDDDGQASSAAMMMMMMASMGQDSAPVERIPLKDPQQQEMFSIRIKGDNNDDSNAGTNNNHISISDADHIQQQQQQQQQEESTVQQDEAESKSSAEMTSAASTESQDQWTLIASSTPSEVTQATAAASTTAPRKAIPLLTMPSDICTEQELADAIKRVAAQQKLEQQQREKIKQLMDANDVTFP